jgi:hypothetical protein
MSKYLVFRELPTDVGRKTKTYEVVSVASNNPIGVVRWFSHWRKYVFAPYNETMYDESCLRDIAQFVDWKTQTQKEGW